MTPSKRLLAIGLTAGIFAGVFALMQATRQSPTTGTAQAQGKTASGDWHMYGGTPQRNMINLVEKNLPIKCDVDDGTNIKWSADLGSKAYGGPVILNGKVFIGTNNQKPRNPADVDEKKRPIDLGVLMCFDEKTGKFEWQTTFKKLAAGRVNDWPQEGICSTPYLEGDLLYYVNNRCELVCAHAKDGSFKWKLDMIKELGVFPHNLAVCSPLVLEKDIWVITANGVDEGHINVPAPIAPSFIKVEKATGKVLWSDNTPTISLTKANKTGDEESFFKTLVNRGDLIQHGQWSNPAYAVVEGQAQIVFPGGDGWLYSFDPAGKLLWKFDCNPKDAKYELQGKGTRNDFIATPVIYKDRVYIAVGQDPEHNPGVGHLWCVAMNKRGDVSPELVTDYSVWPPKTKENPNSAKVWHYGGPILNKEERAKLRRNYYFGRTMSTCAIHEDIVYAAELSGEVHCLDANTGAVLWRHDTGSPSWSSPYWVDNKVYFGNDDGTVTIFAHGKTKKILGTIEVPGRVRATTVAANGILYVMSENKLYAIAEKK